VRQYRIPLERPYDLIGFNLTLNHILILLVVSSTVLVVQALLKWTPFGMQVRATTNNPELARVTGIEPERVYVGLTAVGGLLSGIGGVLIAVSTSLTPLLGWNNLLPLFAVALLGGLGRVGGAALAAMIIGIITQFSLFFIQSSYKVGLAFFLLAVLLVFRPRGLVSQE
jgi:branched-chain amino acid transport system permease protein